MAGRLPETVRGVLRPAPGSPKGPIRDPRRVNPTAERRRHFAHEMLLAIVQFPQKLRFSTVSLVERQPVERHAVVAGTVEKLQGDFPFRPIHHVVGNARRAAAGTIVRPVLGQKQIAVQQAVEIAGGVGEMHRDDAVLRLADGAAPLPFDAGSFVPLLHVAGFVHHADRITPRVIPHYNLLQPLSGAVFFPLVVGQELLQVSGRHPGCQGDRLAAFFAQVGQLALDIGRKMSPRLPLGETIIELFQVTCQHRFQLANLFDVHAKPSVLDGYSFAKYADLRNINPAL